MRLIWFILHGYKRFEAETHVHLDGRLLAISGPNEAGKSSLLDALAHLSHDRPISVRELTRRTYIPADQVILRARFLLDTDDIAAISDLNGGSDARWLIVEKLQHGGFRTGVEPRLRRDLKPRERAVAALRKLEPALSRAEAKAASTTAEETEEGDHPEPLSAAEVASLAGALDVDSQNLSSDAQVLLAEVAKRLGAESDDYGVVGKRALDAVEPLVVYEEEHPHDVARNRLAERRPRFLPFEEDERTLQSEYDLVADVPSLPETAALRNLAALADFDLSAATTAAQAEDVGLLDTLTRRANERLADRFRVSWRQSEITVRFRIDETTLRLLIESPHEPASRIDERSDGMRAFIALLAYTAVNAEGPTRPVLLIDEAEAHLHYAAQADLVQVFTEQTAASQIIYTTHSAGCLPDDLGTGVRLVVPLEGADRSKVINWFWDDDEPGFGPLLHGMGYAVGAFAFTPTRFVVFTEGPTELVLLPTLLREATGRRRLEFQVAPGLALVNRETASTLELEAGRVKYVVDSDVAGRAIAAVLRDGGVDAADIFEMRARTEDGLTIEDFVDGEAYRLAVNEELRRSGYAEHQFARGDIPARGRVSHVEAWAAERGIRNPSKVRVAAQVVEFRGERRLTSGTRRTALRTLYNGLRRSLRIDQALAAGARL
jgi:AAA domain, putative AbiEii toxin, Type IV TA system/AAA domain